MGVVLSNGPRVVETKWKEGSTQRVVLIRWMGWMNVMPKGVVIVNMLVDSDPVSLQCSTTFYNAVTHPTTLHQWFDSSIIIIY